MSYTSTKVKRRYNDKTYKTFRINVRLDNKQIIEKLEEEKSKNGYSSYIMKLIEADLNK